MLLLLLLLLLVLVLLALVVVVGQLGWYQTTSLYSTSPFYDQQTDRQDTYTLLGGAVGVVTTVLYSTAMRK